MFSTIPLVPTLENKLHEGRDGAFSVHLGGRLAGSSPFLGTKEMLFDGHMNELVRGGIYVSVMGMIEDTF